MGTKCFFSSDITETISCCKDGRFDKLGFAEDLCELYPCQKYKNLVDHLDEKERERNGKSNSGTN